ncbi:MAG: DMT family transporter [Ignavibacteriales bacterium]|nr:DMT family transporter [Ignavibacteriales bacterium]MCF8314719.1 DMT family transporter [Ignavibacteriales bacterium]MCF8438033.1 DMT family transporter [Ignavibacteriales bacterium]
MKNPFHADKAPLAVIFAAMLWGLDGIVFRPFLYNLPVSLVVFIETALVAVLMTPVIINSTSLFRSMGRKDWIAFIGVAFFGGVLGTMLITKALFYVDYINLSIVILLQKLQPVFAILFAVIILKEKQGLTFYLWAAISVIGSYFMTFGLNFPVSPNSRNLIPAALLAIGAAMAFALSTVLSKRGLRNIDFLPATYLRFSISALLMTVIVASTGNYSQIYQVTLEQVGVFLLIAFSSGGVAIMLYYYGLKQVPASVSTILELAFPLTAIILEYFIRDHIFSPVQWAGSMILLFSIIRISRISASSVILSKTPVTPLN